MKVLALEAQIAFRLAAAARLIGRIAAESSRLLPGTGDRWWLAEHARCLGVLLHRWPSRPRVPQLENPGGHPGSPAPATGAPALETAAGDPERGGTRVTVMIPTYRERQVLPTVLDDLWAAIPESDVSVWVLDDRSPDGTGDIVRSLCDSHESLALLCPTMRRGRGGAVLLGIQHWLALRENAGTGAGVDLVAEMDGDGSHDPAALVPMLEAAREHDVVLGSRYIPGGRASLAHRRRALSWLANLFARWVLGLPYRDCSTGYRCYQRTALERLDLDAISCQGHATHLELLFKLHRAGARIGEVPIHYAARKGGESKVEAAEVVRVLLSLVRMRLRSGTESGPS